MKIPVFIDCDPGTDDVIALLLAAKIPEIEVVGIGAVCGNVECSTTYNNARILIRRIDRDELLQALVKNYLGAE